LRVERQLGYKQAEHLTGVRVTDTLAGVAGGRGGYWEDRGYEWYAAIRGSAILKARRLDRPAGRWIIVVLALVIVAGLIALAATWRPSIAAITPPSASSFASSEVERGSALAHLGYCSVCHSAPGGAPYAGGLKLKTPFGVIYSTNITPDPSTGIGRWSLQAFDRAMRQGVARNGAHLYPALPYDHFTHASDSDLRSIYAFLMTRAPVRARPPANRLIPPLGFRPLLAGWKLLFLHTGPVASDPSRSAEWNRGRYLAEGLSHCGGCHTPRNPFGAEERGHAYDGGYAEGWYAPPLNAASPAAQAWTVERMDEYLRTGLSHSHEAAAGPMGNVARQLAAAPIGDVHAISVYITSQMARAPASHAETPAIDRAAQAAEAHPQGAALYAGACANCHGSGAPMMLQGRPQLSLGTPLDEKMPRDVIQVLLWGLTPPVGRSGPYMPPFGDSLSDGDVADLAAYLRARYSDRPPWPGDLTREVAKARKEGQS
jgi:mono/diheme cytochrome c family protein